MILQKYLQDKNIDTIELVVNSNIDKLSNLLDLIYKDNILDSKIKTWKITGEDIGTYFQILDTFYNYKEYLADTTITTSLYYLDAHSLIVYKMEKQLFDFAKCNLDILYYLSNPDENNDFYSQIQLGIRYKAFITPDNIDNWKNYFQKWKSIYKNYGIYPDILEIRNNNWTKEQIETYCDLLQYMIWDKFKTFRFNAKKVAKNLWTDNFKTVDPIAITLNKLPCKIQNILCIELDNLNIIPCHKTNYSNLYIGQMADPIVEKNLEIGLSIWDTVPSNLPRCSNCEFNKVCGHQCFSASYDQYGEMFIPTQNTCELQQKKFITLYRAYKRLGIIKAAKKLNLLSPELIEVFNFLDSIVVF